MKGFAMAVSEPQAESPPRKRRWLQYSLRTLLVFAVLASIVMSWVAVTRNKLRERKRAVAEIKAVGGTFAYELSGPAWMQQIVADEECFIDPLRVTLGDARPGRWPRMNDSGLHALVPALRQFPGLVHLDLMGSDVTDRGIDEITTLTNLEVLDLRDTQISDAGLNQLRGLTKLKELRLTRRQITQDGIERFRQALPNCTITE